MSALPRKQQSHFTTDSTGSSNDESDLAAEFCFRRHALQFGFFERPVLDAECLGSGKRHVVMELSELLRLFGVAGLRKRMRNFSIFESIRTGHHVNGIDEELGCDSRFLLILAKTEQAQAGDDNDGGIGISQLWRITGCPRVVIFLVGGSIFDSLDLDARLQNAAIIFCRIPRKKEWADPRSQKMIGTTGSK